MAYMGCWLVVGPPLWKIWKSIGMMRFPIYGKNKKCQPNHQPVWVDRDCYGLKIEPCLFFFVYEKELRAEATKAYADCTGRLDGAWFLRVPFRLCVGYAGLTTLFAYAGAVQCKETQLNWKQWDMINGILLFFKINNLSIGDKIGK